MNANRKPKTTMEELLSEMMQQKITMTMFYACTVENRRYTDEEYMALTHVKRFKLSLIRDSADRPIGSYNATKKGKFQDKYFNKDNWPNGGP